MKIWVGEQQVRNMTLVHLASIVLIGFLFQAKEAQSTTVEQGIKYCEANFIEQPTLQQVALANFCLGMTDGVARIMTLNCFSVKDGAKPEAYLSADPPPSTRAAVQAFLNWAKENPQEWGEEFNVGLMQSMYLTFPCMALGK
jgi:hypothetical protein